MKKRQTARRQRSRAKTRGFDPAGGVVEIASAQAGKVVGGNTEYAYTAGCCDGITTPTCMLCDFTNNCNPNTLNPYYCAYSWAGMCPGE